MSSPPLTPTAGIPLQNTDNGRDTSPATSHSQSHSFSRLWERLASSPTFSAFGVGTSTSPASDGNASDSQRYGGVMGARRVIPEPVVSRAGTQNMATHDSRGSRRLSQQMSGSWTDRTVPRWGYSKEQERERERAGRSAGTGSHASSSYELVSDDSDDDQDDLVSRPAVLRDDEDDKHVDDEACFVDGWDGKVGECRLYAVYQVMI